jgi:ferredoxin hydrogenase small subunit
MSNDIMKLTRRQFVKSAGFTVGMCLVGVNFTKRAYAQAKEYLSERQLSVYKQDAAMKYRKSQDSPAIAKIYKDFLHEPCGHVSHELLHTHYHDRSAALKAVLAKGVKLKIGA